jgi:hypothetical protein
MSGFLTPEWAEELADLLRRSDEFEAAAGAARLHVRHLVSGAPRGDLVWDLHLDPDSPSVTAGAAGDAVGDAQVTVSVTWAVAVALASGETTMRHAEAQGDLEIEGDVTAFFRHNAAITCVDQLQSALDTDFTGPGV